MCTWLMKFRVDKVLKLHGISCCMSVEDVEEVAPDISRVNGWQEVFVDTEFPGKSVIWVSLSDEAICRLRNIRPAGMLEYRGKAVHFMSRDRMIATRDYIVAKLRRAADFPPHESFLENLPAEFLKASARERVLRLLDRQLECA